MPSRHLRASCLAASGPEVRMKLAPRSIECSEAEEHVARRLGKAVLALWSDLPPEVRNALFEQALLVHDRQEAADLRHEIWALILKHQGDLS